MFFARQRILPIAVLALACLISASARAGYTRINAPHPDDLMNVQIYRLDNGLTVYLTENHETPRFYAEIFVRSGSKHDPAETTGLAHYLEHLLFKGNREMGTLDYRKEKRYLDEITRLYEKHFRETNPKKQKAIYARINRVSQKAAQYAIPGEMDKLYNAMGSTHLNAHTSQEETVYKVGLPANRLEHWAAIESARFVDPVFRLFHTELETVYEEKNRSLDNKDWLTYDAINAMLFKVHPYGQQPIIGKVEHLKRPSIENIYEYYNTYYVPNNMAIAISGDIRIHEAIEVIDRYFSAWEPKALPKPRTWTEEPLQGVERATVRFKGEEYVELAWRTVSYGHPDAEALLILDFILDNAVAGLININLNQQQRVRHAGATHRQLNDYGSENLSGTPKDGQTLEEVEQLLLDQIVKLKTGDFEGGIIPAIITDFEKNQKAQLESNLARVTLLRNAFLRFEAWDRSVEKLDRLRQLTKEDIVDVANRYFGDRYVAVYRVDEQQDIPTIEKPKIDPLDIDPSRQSAFAKSVLDMPYTEIEPVFVDPDKDFTKIDLASGNTLYYAPNPLNDLFSFSIAVDMGTRHSDALAIATMLTEKSGTETFNADTIKQEWYRLGTDFHIGAGDNATRIGISGLDANFGPSLALLMDLIQDPQVSESTLEELKGIVLVSRQDAKKDPRTLNRALLLYHRYGDQSPFLKRLPEAELMRLTVEDLQRVIRDLLGYKHTISYTGSLPLETLLELLKTYHPERENLKKPPPYVFMQAHAPDTTEVFLVDEELAQAQVRIEFGDGVVSEADRTAIELYNSYFAGGMSGIVFQELREARGLAYSAGARYITGSRTDEENLMVGVIGCQADKTNDALEAFIDLFDNLPESPERYAETVDALLNRYRTSKIGFRNVIGSVRSWERLGLSIDPRAERYEALQAVEIETLFDFHKEHISGQPKLISIVGDASKIDVDRLAKVGTVTMVSVDELFTD